ncbi:MAG: hypothetical protein AB7F88_11315 [Pyrinomonadaceae bacterium]
MSEKTVEWLAILIFFFVFFALTLGEAGWLNKKGGASLNKAFAFSFASNIFTVVVGFSLSFVVFAAVLALAFGGAFEGLSGNDWRLWAAVIAGALFPLVLSALAKRLGLRIFKLHPVLSPWAFSFIASIIFVALVAAAPTLFIYFT